MAALVDIGLIRTRLVERLGLLDGLWAYAGPQHDIKCGPAGAALVSDAELDDFVAYHQVGSQPDVRVLFEVELIVAATSAADARLLLDDYRGVGTPRSIVTLLEDGGNLSGACDYVVVTGVGPAREYDQASPDARLWETTFAVEVRA